MLKAIILRYKFINTFLKKTTEEKRTNCVCFTSFIIPLKSWLDAGFTKTKEIYVSQVYKNVREYFENLDEKNLCDDKKVW